MTDIHRFKGTGGAEECAEFIRSVEAHPLARLYDDAYMTGFASNCFSGNVPFWYENLDEEIRVDWKRLQQALLHRYGPDIPSSLVPTPATAPPQAPLVPNPAATEPQVSTTIAEPRRGRFRVIATPSEASGYLSRGSRDTETWSKGCYGVDPTTQNALLVEYTPAVYPYKIKVLNSTIQADWLGAIWHNHMPIIGMESLDYCALTSVVGSGTPSKHNALTDATAWPGPIRTAMWDISRTGDLGATWLMQTFGYDLEAFVLRTAGGHPILLFASDFDTFNEYFPGSCRARLVFEPI